MPVGARRPLSAVVVSLCVLVGGLVFTAAPALAAAPEAPGAVTVESITATTANLRGVLNPGTLAELPQAGTYEFLYNETSAGTGCKGGLESKRGLSLGNAGEEVYEGSYGIPVGSTNPPFVPGLTGLSADTQYSVCLLARNLKGEETVGPAATFTTAIPVETPEVRKAEPVVGTDATLRGIVNPNAPGNHGTYRFLYDQSATECEHYNEYTGEEEIVKKTSPEVSLGNAHEAAQTPVSELLPGTMYTFCLVARNEAGEESAVSAPATFMTPTIAPRIVSESVSMVEAASATLEAQIDPDGAETTYHFEYDTTPYETSAPHGTDTPDMKIPAGTSAVSENARLKEVLTPGTTYYYRVVAENKVGGKTETEDGKDMTFTTSAAPVTTGEACPNAKLRAEQPHASTLPDCRAYEMVSPVDTEGQDATDSFGGTGPRAAVSGEAIIYSAKGTFADPAGDDVENQFVSRRGPDGWSTQSVTPPEAQQATEERDSFEGNDLTPELTEGVADATAKLTSEAPGEGYEGLYVDDFAKGSYRYVNGSDHELGNVSQYPLGSSTDLTHVVFGYFGEVSEWVNGDTVPVGVANDGENMDATVGAIEATYGGVSDKSVWRAVSADGSRVYFTSPAKGASGQLYVRVHAERSQSPIGHADANATGTLEEGSGAVAEVTPVFAANSFADLTAGSTAVNLNAEGAEGTVHVGQVVTGPGIPTGTTVTGVSGTPPRYSATLSAPATLSSEEVVIFFYRPSTFVTGERISGYGLAPGTTVTGVGSGTLTLSSPADVSASEVALAGGGECTEAAKACTVEVSASQRSTSDTHGLQATLYWGASTGAKGPEGAEDGPGPERVFFTSDAELTDDAYTGSADNAANLYEYDLETSKLTDLTGDETDASGEGAAVQGVVQISEDGSYVYFVAEGALAGPKGEALQNERGEDPQQGEPNLYVSHKDGAPVFIATLAHGDKGDWHVGSYEGEGGPGQNTAVVTPGGSRLAFLSEKSLTGYDNEQAEPGECQGSVTGSCEEVYLYDAGSGGVGSLVCASCNPTGARPVGPSSFTTEYAQAVGLYRRRNLLEDGALFFDSSDALVPHTSDRRRNVYEYENGHIYPISDVAGGYESFFMDASANGDDVFFGTADQLLPQDVSNNVVVYDARVGGGFPVAAAAPSCDNADSCKPPESPQPPIFGAPSSATFSGLGNPLPPPPPAVVKPKSKPLTRAQKLAKALKVCAKDKKTSKRAKCQRRAKQKYGASKAKKSAHANRRTH